MRLAAAAGVIMRLVSRWGRRPGALTVLALLLGGQALLAPAHRWAPRQATFDFYQRLKPRAVERLPVRIVDVDEASLARLGRWPWPRTRLAELVDRVAALGPLAIGLDMLLSEPDRLSPSHLVEAYPGLDPELRQRLSALPSSDEVFAAVIRRHPVVVARAGFAAPRGAPPRSARFPVLVIEAEDPRPHLIAYQSVLANVPAIETAARGHGFVNSTVDRDGVVRRVPVIARVGEDVGGGLALETLRVATGGDAFLTVRGDAHGALGVRIGDAFLPTDGDGAISLYFSPPDPRRKVSAADVLSGELPAGAFDGHVVLIGVTGLGLTDAPPTPVAGRMDGVEIQAQLIENLLDGERLIRPRHASLLEGLALVLAGGVLILGLPRLGPVWGLALTLALVAAMAGGGFALFTGQRLLIDPSYGISGIGLLYVLMLSSMLAEGIRQRRLLNAQLERERIASARLAGELGAARDIQMGILPDTDTIAGLPASLRVHGMLEPAREVGGDLYDVFMLDEHRLFFVVGDVAGKGIPASLFMAISKVLCKSVALRAHASAAETVMLANAEISRENPATLFVTAVAGVIDARTGELDYCIAGHDAPCLLRPGQPPLELASAGGPPLCALDEYPYPAERYRMRPGEILLLTTDGVTEAMDADGTLYGRPRLLRHLAAGDGWSGPRSLVEALDADVRRFAGAAEVYDDITILAVQYVGDAS